MYRYILETIIDLWSTYLYSVTDIVVTSADILKDINDPDPENGERENKPVVHFFTADGKHMEVEKMYRYILESTIDFWSTYLYSGYALHIINSCLSEYEVIVNGTY